MGPGSQHGFIILLVAPLVFSTVDLLPQLRHLSTQMAVNLEEWLVKWRIQTKPTKEALEKKYQEVANMRDEAELRHARLETRSVRRGSHGGWKNAASVTRQASTKSQD